MAEVHAVPEPQAEVAAAPEPIVEAPAPKPHPGVLQEFVSDLESTLGENFLSGAPKAEATPASPRPELEPIGNAAPTRFGTPEEPMGVFVADLEASLGEDFLKGAPVAESESVPQSQPEASAEAPVAAHPAQPTAEPSVPPVTAPPIAAAAAAASGAPAVSAVSKPQAPKAPAPGASPFAEDAGVDLAEMFGELKHDLEVGATTTEEDPETHYNLGIAFREMGLLDEAIGELQKTCQAVDRGHSFPQVMQTYTWLAQCFLDKGVPQAAIRWYDKALTAPGVDEDTRTALHYELAAAYETAGDKPAALKHFMEVYGRNIDYRDVAERIKPLKS
jgi:hypothetical protein